MTNPRIKNDGTVLYYDIKSDDFAPVTLEYVQGLERLVPFVGNIHDHVRDGTQTLSRDQLNELRVKHGFARLV